MIEAILRSTTAGLLVLGILWLLRLGPARRRVLAARIGLLGVLFALTGLQWQLPSLEAPLVVAQSSTVVPPAEDPSTVLPVILWVLGALIAGVPLLFGSLQLRRLWRMGTQVGNAAPWVKARVGEVPTPLVFGFPGKVLLPKEFSEWGPVDQRNAMEHELAHIRAKDPIWIVVFGVATAAFWWHPIVRILATFHRRDIELAADQAVLSSGVEPADYAQTLLTLAKPRGLALGCPAAGVGPLEERIRGALGFSGLRRRVPLFLLPVAVATAAIAMVGFADREVIVRAFESPEPAPSVTLAVTSRPLKESPALTVASSPKRSPKRKNRAKPTVSRTQTPDNPDPVSAESPLSRVSSTDPISGKEPGGTQPSSNPFGTTSSSSAFPKLEGRQGEGSFGSSKAESPVQTHPHPLPPLPRAGRGEIGDARPQSTSGGAFQKSLGGSG